MDGVSFRVANTLESAIRALEAALDTTPPEVLRKRENEEREFRYIPLSPSYFLTQMETALKLTKVRKPKFIDVGCGIGTKVLLAREMLRGVSGGEAFGIEKFPPYVDIAKRLLQTYNFRLEPQEGEKEIVIKGDALKHSYAPYDIIYFYCPIIDREVQKKLEERIVKTCKVGTVILANGPKSDLFWKDGGLLKREPNNIWIKEANK